MINIFASIYNNIFVCHFIDSPYPCLITPGPAFDDSLRNTNPLGGRGGWRAKLDFPVNCCVDARSFPANLDDAKLK